MKLKIVRTGGAVRPNEQKKETEFIFDLKKSKNNNAGFIFDIVKVKKEYGDNNERGNN